MDFSAFTIDNIANGLLFIVLGVLSWLGIKRGGEQVKDNPPSQPVAEIAGALVDASSIRELVKVIEKHASEAEKGRSSSRENTAKMERAINSLAKETETLHQEIGTLKDEIIRSSRK